MASEDERARSGTMQDDSLHHSTAEILVLTLPLIAAMILSMWRLDERAAKPTRKNRAVRPFCEIGPDGQPTVTDPGSASRAGGLPVEKMAGRRRSYVVEDDAEG